MTKERIIEKRGKSRDTVSNLAGKSATTTNSNFKLCSLTVIFKTINESTVYPNQCLQQHTALNYATRFTVPSCGKFSWKKNIQLCLKNLEILEKEHFFKSTTFEFDAILLHPFFKKGASYAFTPLVNFCQAIPPKHFAHIALQEWVW